LPGFYTSTARKSPISVKKKNVEEEEKENFLYARDVNANHFFILRRHSVKIFADSIRSVASILEAWMRVKQVTRRQSSLKAFETRNR
jgi:hypothetical protein